MNSAILILAVAASQASSQPAQPIGNFAEWIEADDYPAEALRQGAEGTVGFELDIAASGEVEGCMVTHSSGVPVLDDRTCAVMRERARFLPARNEQGKAIASKVHRRVRWAIPDNAATPMPLAEFSVAVRFEVDEAGRPVNCRTVESSGFVANMGDACSGLVEAMRFAPPPGEDLGSSPKTVTYSLEMKIED